MDAKKEISESDIFESLIASLREGLETLESQTISEIICFGLGKIGECSISRYQLALLLCLKDLFKVNVQVYDPIFSTLDINILKVFEVSIIENNSEGKFKVSDKNVLFFLPHCPKQLSNNLLWVNWGLSLKNCIIIANSFNGIIESSSSRTIKACAEYISRICPYTLELPMINSFKYFEVFNDTAIHCFPKLNLLPQDIWDQCPEPVYLEDNEFISVR